jgi:hypothetical protein
VGRDRAQQDAEQVRRRAEESAAAHDGVGAVRQSSDAEDSQGGMYRR